jgi:hypothetical protein
MVVGQRGPIWFLGGFFGGTDDKPVTRTCSVPADKVLFFPVANNFSFNTPTCAGRKETYP